jgi:hypothetical protein
VSLEDILEDRWNIRIDRNMGTPKEAAMDLSKLTTEELQEELNRRRNEALILALRKRRRVGEVLCQACNDIPDFKALLVPNPKGELHTAIYGNSEDYEITLSCYYNPLKEDDQ